MHFFRFFSNNCRMMIIRLVFERMSFGRSLESFPVNFVQFFEILWLFEKKFIFGQGQFSIWWGFCEILKYTVEFVLRWLCNFACQSKSLEVLQTCFRNGKGHLTPREHNAQWIRCVRLLEQKLCGKNYPVVFLRNPIFEAQTIGTAVCNKEPLR